MRPPAICRTLTLATAVAAFAASVGCEKEPTYEDAGERLDQAIQRVEEAKAELREAEAELQRARAELDQQIQAAPRSAEQVPAPVPEPGPEGP